jgi:ligand-binding sensor domain-containing protein/signal transduction histidine kinase
MSNGIQRRLGAEVAASIVLLVSPISSGVLLALSPEKAITQYSQSIWQTEQGLPENSVQAILQTSDGYIWLGTEEGLVRFDGVRFTVFDKQNTKAIKHNNISSLYESTDGCLWIGTYAGLTRYKQGEFSAYTSKEGLPGETVVSMIEAQDGSLWVSIQEAGLARIKDGKITAFTTADGLSNNNIRFVKEDGAGRLWIGTDDGLNRYENGKFRVYRAKDGLFSDTVNVGYHDRAGNFWVGTDKGLTQFRDGNLIPHETKDALPVEGVTQIHEAQDGSLWLGTRSGLFQCKNQRFTNCAAVDNHPQNQISQLYEDHEGVLWIASYGNGLTRYKDGRFTSYTSKDGLPDDKVWAVYEDRESNLWIGTKVAGLVKLEDGKFTTYGAKEGLSNDTVWSFHESLDGSLWIGTGKGLNRLKDGKVTVFTTNEGLSANIIYPICESRDGSLWIGTRSGGLNQYKNGKFKIYTTKDGLVSDWIKAIHQDRAGDIWVGTGNGLSRLKNGRFTNYTIENGIPSNIIWTIHEGHDGSLWFGTSGGLSQFKDGKFTNYTVKDGLSHNFVCSIHEDLAGVLWIGTVGGGLNRLKDGKFTSYTVDQGLFDNIVYQVLEDDIENLWMSCNKGIFRVSKNELNAQADGRIKAVRSIAYGAADGMRSRECNGGVDSAAIKVRDGRLLFGTIKGLVMIDPNHIKVNVLPPPVVIEQVLLNKTPLDLRNKQPLRPTTGDLEFHYTALSYVNPSGIKFKYELEGYDKDWVDAGDRRVAYYTNLPPGSYRFRVIACNSDGVWNESGATFEFYLRPHFYQTKWFYALCALSVALAGFGIYRLRVRQLRRRTRELEKTVDQRTGELKSSQERVLRLEKQATEQLMAGGFAHEMRNALAGSKLILDQALALDGPEPRVSLNLANCRNLKEMYLGLKDELPENKTQIVLGQMQTIFANEERLDEVMQLVRKATSRGLNITQQIMDYSKLGQQQPGQQSVNPHNLIMSIINESREEFSSQGVVIEYKSKHQVLTLTGDETHFYSIIKNVILNARDALIDPSLKDRKDRCIEITTARNGSSCCIVIADNGIGIPQENLQKVFEPFFSTKPATGTGLGLGVVKRMISIYNGSIDVRSEVGKRTSVTISLPLSGQGETV